MVAMLSCILVSYFVMQINKCPSCKALKKDLQESCPDYEELEKDLQELSFVAVVVR